jgi:glycosyltransferase involved in cell wall biosynthesis
MKILHAVLSEGFYGSERHCIELATAQARAGHQVEVLIHDGGSHCARAFRDGIAAANAAVAAKHGAGGIRLAVIPRAMPALLHRPFARRVLKRFSPDIVHTHLNPAARRVGRVAKRLGIPHVATLHIRYEAREHADCDGLICGASWQKAAIGKEFGGAVAVVWAWLPTAVEDALTRVTPEQVAGLRRDWRADDRTIVFGSIGRLMPEKGMDVLARAFRLAFPHGDEPVRLVILGIGAQEQEVRRLADGDARIAIIGPQPEIAHFYRAFDTYVSASRFEPFGLTILEAMAAGCPLVVTRTQGPREFLTEKTVLWAEPNDEATLTTQLRAAVARGRERQSYDLSPFMQSRAVAAIDALYRSVLQRKRP